MQRDRSISGLGVFLGLVALTLATPALAGIHTWDVNEVFSNADGSIQFVELFEANGTPNEVGVGNGDITSNTQTVLFLTGVVAPPTTNKFYLIATQSFADLPGAPAPDEIILPGSIPFFSTGGDSITFVVYDTWAFGAVPTNGLDSLDRFTGVGANSPTNYAGTTGNVDASPPPPQLPAASTVAVVTLIVVLASAGLILLLRRRVL